MQRMAQPGPWDEVGAQELARKAVTVAKEAREPEAPAVSEDPVAMGCNRIQASAPAVAAEAEEQVERVATELVRMVERVGAEVSVVRREHQAMPVEQEGLSQVAERRVVPVDQVVKVVAPMATAQRVMPGRQPMARVVHRVTTAPSAIRRAARENAHLGGALKLTTRVGIWPW